MTIAQTSNMDRFSRLPTLVLTNILGQLHSNKDLYNLIRASPESLNIYTRYRHAVYSQKVASFLDLDIDGTMLQDALAIINFPPIDGFSRASIPMFLDWIETLVLRNFQYPQCTNSLSRLFTRMVVFIEDYLAKALDPFPARACMTLPTIGRLVPSMQFKGKDTDIKPVSFGELPTHTQRRLLQAFIRYELRCKVYDPRTRSRLETTFYFDMAARLNERLTLVDCEELQSVFEYYRSMYSAVLAQCEDDRWFPDRPVPNVTVTNRRRNEGQHELRSSRELGLLFPDNLYFGPDDRYDRRSSPFILSIGWETLPSLGLDTLSLILKSPQFDITTLIHVEQEAGSLWENFPYNSWITQPVFSCNCKLSANFVEIRHWRKWMKAQNRAREQRDIFDFIDIDQKLDQYRLQTIQSKIYRQRGWIFFTDTPDHHPSLPSSGYIAEQDVSVSDWICLIHVRERRRSQKWQDYLAGRTLENPFLYPSGPNSPARQGNLINRRLDPIVSNVPRFFQSQRLAA